MPVGDIWLMVAVFGWADGQQVRSAMVTVSAADPGLAAQAVEPPETRALREIRAKLESLERSRRQLAFRIRKVRHLVSEPPSVLESEFNGAGDSYRIRHGRMPFLSVVGRNEQYRFAHSFRGDSPTLVDHFRPREADPDDDRLGFHTHYWFPEGAHFANPILPLMKDPRFRVTQAHLAGERVTIMFMIPDGPASRGVRVESGTMAFDAVHGGLTACDLIVQYDDGPSRERTEIRHFRHPSFGRLPDRVLFQTFNVRTGGEGPWRSTTTFSDYRAGQPNDPEFRISGFGFREP